MHATRCLAVLAAMSLTFPALHPSSSMASTTPFTIHWTAPGDDSLVGRASGYELRYSTVPMSAANFSQATKITGLPLPAAAGTVQSFVVSGLTDGVQVYLAIKSVDDVGNWSAISNILTRPGQVTGVDPRGLALSFSSPWPNPARESVHLSYSMPARALVRVDVFDATGRHVRTVADEEREAGAGELAWDLRDARGDALGAGVYFVKARLGATTWTRRLVVVR